MRPSDPPIQSVSGWNRNCAAEGGGLPTPVAESSMTLSAFVTSSKPTRARVAPHISDLGVRTNPLARQTQLSAPVEVGTRHSISTAEDALARQRGVLKIDIVSHREEEV